MYVKSIRQLSFATHYKESNDVLFRSGSICAFVVVADKNGISNCPVGVGVMMELSGAVTDFSYLVKHFSMY